MRFLLLLVVSLVSFNLFGQAPPMAVGGPQGITVARINAQNWMSVPIYVDTPAGPLTGIGWPTRGFMIQTIKNYREATIEEYLKWAESVGLFQLDSSRWQDDKGTIYTLPKGIDSSQVLNYIIAGDTAIWHYTGRQWKRVGGNAEFYFNNLVDGGYITQVSPLSSRKFLVSAAEYIIRGVKYKYDTTQTIVAPPKTSDSTSRIDVITLRSHGAVLLKGFPSTVPLKPRVGGDEIELTTIYYKPFDTIPSIIGSGSKGISSLYRIPGRDSIFYTIDTIKFAIKDSIGISKNDTASMLSNYKYTAANGLTKDSTVFRLGGTLNQNTDINLSSRKLRIMTGTDSVRFFSNGNVSIGTYAGPNSDAVKKFNVYGTSLLAGETLYNGNLLPNTLPGSTNSGLYVLGLTGSNSGAKLQAYTNGGLSPLQSFDFGYYNTQLNSPQTFDSAAYAYDLLSFGTKGVISVQKSGGTAITEIRMQPTFRVGNANVQRSTHYGARYNPIVDSAIRVNMIPFSNTIGSNMFNTTSGNTRIGYPYSFQTPTQYSDTFKLDVNGTGRFADDLYLSSGEIIYGPKESDKPLIIRKNWAGGTYPGVDIGANTFSTNTDAYRNLKYAIGDGNSINGASSYQVNILGHQNNLTNTYRTSVIGGNNVVDGSASSFHGDHIVIGYNNRSDSYSGNIISSVVIGKGNNTNGFYGGGLIGSNLKYYANQQLAFGMNTTNTPGVNSAFVKDVYFGYGVKNENATSDEAGYGNGPDVAINPSWAATVDSINRNGGSLTIAGGRGTGTGTPGTVRFSTWNTTTSGNTLHPTLTERARISPTGNLLIGRTVDSIYKLDVNGTARIAGNTTITNNGYLLIPTNNKIQIGQAGANSVTGFNTFITNNMPSVEGQSNTYLGYSDNNNNTSGNDNTIIGAINNRVNTTGSNNVIVGTRNRNIFASAMTQNNCIFIGNQYSTGSSTTFDKVIGIGADGNRFGEGGTYSNIIDFYGGNKRPINNTMTIGSSGSIGIQLDTIFFNGYSSNWPGRNIVISGSNANSDSTISSNLTGGNITIAAGRGTGNASPGHIAFSTSTATTSGTTLQTLSERARISPAGNLLVGTTTDEASSKLTVSSTTQGFLPPRMTGAQAEAIVSPAEGLMIYCNNGNGTTITSKGWWGYDGSTWVKLN